MKYLDAKKLLIFASATVRYINLVSKSTIITEKDIDLFIEDTITHLYGEKYIITSEDKAIIKKYVTGTVFKTKESSSIEGYAKLATKLYKYLIHKGNIEVDDKAYVELSNKCRLEINEKLQYKDNSELLTSLYKNLSSVNNLSITNTTIFEQSYPIYFKIMDNIIQSNKATVKATQSYLIKSVTGITSLSKAELYLENLISIDLKIDSYIINNDKLNLYQAESTQFNIQSDNMVIDNVVLNIPDSVDIKINSIENVKPVVLLRNTSNLNYFNISDYIQSNNYVNLETEISPEPPVPTDYQRVEYIYTTTRGSYLETNYLANINTKIITKVGLSRDSREGGIFADDWWYKQCMLSMTKNGSIANLRHHFIDLSNQVVLGSIATTSTLEAGNAYLKVDNKFNGTPYIVITTQTDFPVSNGCGAARVGNYAYIFGNINSSTMYYVYKYDLINNTWSRLDNLFPDGGGCYLANRVVAINDQIYIMNGYSKRKIYQFDTVTESFIGSWGFPEDVPFIDEACCGYDNKIYMFGGKTSGTSNSNTITIFDTKTKTFEKLSVTLPENISNACCEIIDTNVYIFAGKSSTTHILVFDLINQTTSVFSESLPVSSNAMECAKTPEGIYLFGGFGNSRICKMSSYDLSLSIAEGPDTQSFLIYDAGCVSFGTEIYLFGGASTTSQNNKVNKVETISNKLTSYDAPKSLTLFSGWYSSSPYTFTGNMYYLDIYDGEEKVRGYVPCIRVSDNAIGMYDEVNDTFITGSGFVAGPYI